MRGHLKITHTDTRDGSQYTVFDNQQTITDAGLISIIESISNAGDYYNEAGEYQIVDGAHFHNMVLGIDKGAGFYYAPEPETAAYTSDDQIVVLEINSPELTLDYPNNDSIRMRASFDGSTWIPANYPTEGKFVYCSATMRLFNGTTFACKRFPTTVIDVYTTVDITWTIAFSEQV